MSDCRCMTPPFNYLDYDSESIGIDETKGRFGEVSIETCKACGAKWLVYFVEYPSFTASGRWYRGPFTPEMLASVTPDGAFDLLKTLPWCFYGGSYFKTTGDKSVGPIGPEP